MRIDAIRFDHGQWWWEPDRTRLARTRIGAWWLRRRLPGDVQWRISRVPRGRR